MNNVVVPNADTITSFVFYTSILQQTNNIIKQRASNEIHFDFTRVKKINPLVIPNILCLGQKCRAEGLIPHLYVPSCFDSSSDVMPFLYNCKFKEINSKQDIFVLEEEMWGGFREYKFDSSYLIYSRNNLSEQEVYYNIREILQGINFGFRVLTDEIINLIHELIINSIEHGKSLSYSSISYTSQMNVLHIAVSDMGWGFHQTINSKIKNGRIIDPKRPLYPAAEECILHLMTLSKAEPLNANIYAIISSVVYRWRADLYGIFSIFLTILEMYGKIRIHSNDTQIILSDQHIEYFRINENMEKDVKNKMVALCQVLIKQHVYDIRHANVRRNVYLPGVHYEIDLRVKKEDKGNDYI